MRTADSDTNTAHRARLKQNDILIQPRLTDRDSGGRP
jgi:hypothetical protein